MTWPRLAGHQFRLTPENQGDPWVWRHTTLVTRPPHRRLDRMRRNLSGRVVVTARPPRWGMSRTVDPTNEAGVRAVIDGYGATMRRRLGKRIDRYVMNVALSDQLGLDSAALYVEVAPKETR